MGKNKGENITIYIKGLIGKLWFIYIDVIENSVVDFNYYIRGLVIVCYSDIVGIDFCIMVYLLLGWIWRRIICFFNWRYLLFLFKNKKESS